MHLDYMFCSCIMVRFKLPGVTWTKSLFIEFQGYEKLKIDGLVGTIFAFLLAVLQFKFLSGYFHQKCI